MGCATCGTGGCVIKSGSTVGGCRNHGFCKTGGCNRMNSFDWLANMQLPTTAKLDIVEVKFKGGRKEFYRNPLGLELFTGDAVVVDAENGYHIGLVTLQGELVRLQMLKKKVSEEAVTLGIYRLATEKDMEKFEQARNRELPTLYRTREIISEMGLKMKLSDVEYQADNTKATFYYSADERVDFRQLIKVLASEFKIRVEMRQISLRQEAGRLGGIGSCGRELCCSTWLSDFKTVTTAAARYQNLSLNPSKLSGQCGRLKCCLNYELDTYLDALIDIPEVEKPLLTERGEAYLQKVDIFKKILWFSYKDEETTWHPVSAERVKQIMELNEKGIVVFSLSETEEKHVRKTKDMQPLEATTLQETTDSKSDKKNAEKGMPLKQQQPQKNSSDDKKHQKQQVKQKNTQDKKEASKQVIHQKPTKKEHPHKPKPHEHNKKKHEPPKTEE